MPLPAGSVCPPGTHYVEGRGCVVSRYENPSNTGDPGNLGGAPETQPGTGTVPECPPGQRWDDAKNTCVSSATTPGSTTPTPPTDAGGGACPPGQEMRGQGGNRRCRPIQPAAASGGGGGGAGRAAAAAPVVAPGQDIDSMIESYIKGLLQGEGPFSNDVVARLQSGLISDREGAIERGNRDLDEELVGSNMYRSGLRTRGRVDVRSQAESGYGRAIADVRNKQVAANWEAKLQGLDRAQKYLDSLRDYYLRKDANDIQRQIGLAQVKLGYAKIDAEKQMLEMQLSRQGGGGGGPDPLTQFLQLLQNSPFGS